MSDTSDNQIRPQEKATSTDRQSPNPAVRDEMMAFLLTPGLTHRERRSKPVPPPKAPPRERS